MDEYNLSLFFEFLWNEETRINNQLTQKWNFCYLNKKFDTLDLLDFIELIVQRDYLDYFCDRFAIVVNLAKR